MLLSISIVNWCTTPLLEALLESIFLYPPECELEVIAVDNASPEFNEAAMKQAYPQVHFIVNSTNDGYARGNNQAIQKSSGDLVLLLNPDTEVTEGALNHLVRFMVEHPRAAAAGGKLVKPDGSIDRSLRSFPYPGPIAWEYLGLAKLFPKSRTFSAYRMNYFDYNTVSEVDQPMGSCLIMSRKAIEKIGVMDEDFPIFFNEVDWLYRARLAGYLVYYTPDAVIIHHGAGSTKQVAKKKMTVESHRSLLDFYKKHFKGNICPLAYWFTVGCIRLSKAIKGAGA